VTRLWDDDAGLFRVRDLATDTLVGEDAVTGLVPLLAPPPAAARLSRLVDTLTGPRFDAPATHLIPSYDLTGRAFDAGATGAAPPGSTPPG
jgi:hypothetical protein